jgi:hypothetical protein
MSDQAFRDTLMEIEVSAALSGHDLMFEALPDRDGEYQATCRYCQKTVWVKNNGLFYSLLDEQDCLGLNGTAE